MICRPCRSTRHKMCDGKSWCDCQHRGEDAAEVEGGSDLDRGVLCDVGSSIRVLDEDRDRLILNPDQKVMDAALKGGHVAMYWPGLSPATIP